MALNVNNGLVDGNAIIYAPGTNMGPFTTVSDIMNEADASLAVYGDTTDPHPQRAYQEALKNALDKANNNLNFLHPDPSGCPLPVFP